MINPALYSEWPVRPVADPRKATAAQFMHGLTEILTHEAPIQGLHLFQTYAKAGGLLKITRPVRSRFERVVLEAEKAGSLVIERENDTEIDDEHDPRGWIIRLPEQDRVKIRTLGPRGFAEIPMSELAALILDIRIEDEFMGREEIARAVLDVYGLQKLTALVKRRLDRVLKTAF